MAVIQASSESTCVADKLYIVRTLGQALALSW